MSAGSPRSMGRRQGGFTLIELIAAFVIFALGFGILLQILGDAMRSTRGGVADVARVDVVRGVVEFAGIGNV